ncbi:MAG: hypothetical protein ACI87W_003323 [Halieaceae bacterium]|jgi:hypothetical protein
MTTQISRDQIGVEKSTVGETLLVATCRLEAGQAKALLPPPLEPVRDEAYFYLVWATFHTNVLPLGQRSFYEANISLPCLGPEGEGTWFYKAYFPGRHMVLHANLSGWSGEEAEVAIGRVPLSIQQFVWPPSQPVGGWAGFQGRRHFEMDVTVSHDVALAETPLAHFNKVYGVRNFSGERDVTLEEHHGEDVIARAMQGSCRLDLSKELREKLQVREVGEGYLLELGIVLGKSRRVG